MELQRITIWIILGTVLLIQTSLAVELDNGGGGTWQETITFYLKSATAEYGHYKIVIDESACKIYNVMGDPKACQPNGNFWSLVQSDGEDIRVYNQSAQLYFWVEEWDYTNKTAVIWVNLSAGSEELNIAYGNPSATKSNYENGEQVFEFFDDFEGDSLDTNKWNILGSPAISVGDGVVEITVDASGERIETKNNIQLSNCIIEAKLRFDNFNWRVLCRTKLKNGYLAQIFDYGKGDSSIGWNTYGGAWGTEETLLSSSNTNTWYIWQIIKEADSFKGVIADEQYNVLAQSSERTLADLEFTILFEAGTIGSGTTTFTIDWIKILKLADPADFATEGGEPETNTTHIVSFKVYRCFKPVKNAPVKVKYKGKLVGCGYTDDTGSIAFRLGKLKTYEIDINKSEKIVTIQPLENNYIITLPCNITQEWEEATYNVTTGSYPWDLLTTAQNLSSQLSPSARGFLSGLVAWVVMYGVSTLGVNAAPVGVIALAGLAVVGLADWVAVLLCCVFTVAMYIIRRGIG